ncbi:DUF523 domain-containing protein [Peptoniphilus asaccharolyticus]
MKIMVSACLLGENCKYNGGNNLNQELKNFLKTHEVIKVCPEVMGGLSTPRVPAEIVSGEVINREGQSVDFEFRNGALRALEKAYENRVDLVVLQSRSPSCGAKEIYDGTFSGKLIEGKGIFARLLEENGFNIIDVEDFFRLRLGGKDD